MALLLGSLLDPLYHVFSINSKLRLNFLDDLKMSKVQRVNSCNTGMLLLLLLTLCFEFSKHYSGKIDKIAKKKDI